MSAPELLLLATYYLALSALALYGAHRLLLAAVFWRTRRPTPPPSPPGEWPLITVQLPLYNEMYVVERLLEAVKGLDYPRHRLEVQVLDDSDDETTALAAAAVEPLRREGLEITLLHRDRRTGYKAGALAAGLAVARGDLVAVFDADFVPDADFLRRVVPHFADPRVGMVQARWGYLNRDFSLLTRLQAILLDGHFVVEHAARHGGGCFFNFNGTAGVWRRQAIVSAGGWQHDTLTEDLDLSYRAQLLGWRFVYLPEVVVPCELPVDANAFKSQQRRWAKGSMQTGRKLLRRVLQAPLPLRVKLEAGVHLTNNLSYPLSLVVALLIFPAMALRLGSSPRALLLIDVPLFLGATLSVLLFYVVGQIGGGRAVRRELHLLPALLALGVGLAVNNGAAVLGGLLRRGGVFERTPKLAVARRGEPWRGRRYLGRSHPSLLGEGILAAYFLVCFWVALRRGMWMSLPFLYLFLQGYTYLFCLSLGRARGAAEAAGAGLAAGESPALEA
jgi:cellulose synthase/poly-beta-1,6-N-acetylglucosamine synthase-like glycosyltransferase